MNISEIYIARCVELAGLGLGNVQPNPMVGCVIVHNNKIIGEGYHQKYGEAHAEVNAIYSVKNTSLLKDSTIYVNLEPCAHYGKTPPCAELIVEKKIHKVVIGTVDPHVKVAGKGVEILKKGGCDVITGVLENECKELNKRFFTFYEEQRPYIILKWAQTIDGFIDVIRKPKQENRPTWITDETCRTLVHKWRAEEQAIIVGTNTAEKDNPKLNVRNWKGNDPLRLVIDKEIRLNKDLSLFDHSIPTIIFTSKTVAPANNLEYCKIDFNSDIIPQILQELHNRNIQSLIVEGGAQLLNSFILADIWDEARVFEGEINFTDGIKAPAIKGNLISKDKIGNSSLFVYGHF